MSEIFILFISFSIFSFKEIILSSNILFFKYFAIYINNKFEKRFFLNYRVYYQNLLQIFLKISFPFRVILYLKLQLIYDFYEDF